MSFAVLAWPAVAFSATNVWINSGSGSWSATSNWFGGAPIAGGRVFITNANNKMVFIDASTPAANLTIDRLSLSAPSGSTNTLQFTGASTNTILQLGNTLTMDAGSALNMTNAALSIDGSAGGVFNLLSGDVVLDGGLIDCSTTFIRVGRTSTGTLTLKSGNVLASELFVGELTGSQGTLIMNGGNIFVDALLSLGDTVNSSGTAKVNSGSLILSNGFAKIGNLGNGQFTIAGGTVTFMSEVHIADTAGATGIVSVVGGQLIATNDITAIGRYGVGQLTVSNASTLLTNVSVGRHPGASGTVNIQSNGAARFFDDLSIGRFQGATGAVLVTGGELTCTNQAIWAGREGAGQMIVSNGFVQASQMLIAGTNGASGKVTFAGGNSLFASNFVIGFSGISTGQVVVSAGNLSVTNVTGSGILTVPSGTMTVLGGQIVADKLLLTNNSGRLLFNSGLIQTRSTTANNGLPFVVGDGTNATTLQLLGGVHTFANGLVISSNATVTGCGTIIGSISNFGTLATNCPPPSVNITAVTKTGSTATVFFTTIAGSNHVLEYKNSLTDSLWAAILPGVLGDGSITNKSDTNSTFATRFYHIHVQ